MHPSQTTLKDDWPSKKCMVLFQSIAFCLHRHHLRVDRILVAWRLFQKAGSVMRILVSRKQTAWKLSRFWKRSYFILFFCHVNLSICEQAAGVCLDRCWRRWSVFCWMCLDLWLPASLSSRRSWLYWSGISCMPTAWGKLFFCSRGRY